MTATQTKGTTYPISSSQTEPPQLPANGANQVQIAPNQKEFTLPMPNGGITIKAPFPLSASDFITFNQIQEGYSLIQNLAR